MDSKEESWFDIYRTRNCSMESLSVSSHVDVDKETKLSLVSGQNGSSPLSSCTTDSVMMHATRRTRQTY